MADGVDIDLYADDLEQGFSIKVGWVVICMFELFKLYIWFDI